jgi:hypothetical protein
MEAYESGVRATSLAGGADFRPSMGRGTGANALWSADFLELEGAGPSISRPPASTGQPAVRWISIDQSVSLT